MKFVLEAYGNRLLSNLTWPAIWAVILAFGWLLPNHYLPWIAFHTDTWVAGMLALAGFAIAFHCRKQLEWTGLTVTAALAALIPAAQYVGGLLLFSGQAWVTTAYLSGFLLSVMLGARWEKYRSGQALDALLFAIALASVVSVGIQLYQWMGFSGENIWIVYLASNRPFANLIQPNQLATLLLWGVIATGWFAHRRKIGSATAIFMAMFLLLGIALTQSRTPMLAVIFCIAAGWHWRKLWYTKKRFQILVGLVLFYVICILSIGPVSNFMFHDQRFNAVERITSGDIRLSAYKLFVDAILQRPFFGFGWTNLGPAQMLVAENHAELGGVFQHAHNLFLDLILWSGLPTGLLLGGVLLSWFFLRLKKVSRIEDAFLLLFVGVFWWHAMLELPHQYAYMLLPVGMVMGCIEVRTATPVLFRTSRVFFTVLLISTFCLLGLIVRDYFRIEADFEALRFERQYGMSPPQEIPETLVLSQLEALIKMGRIKARTGASHDELNWMRNTANIFPSPANQFVYIEALALNGYHDQAQQRMKLLQKVMEASTYDGLGKIWFAKSEKNPLLAKTEWLPIIVTSK